MKKKKVFWRENEYVMIHKTRLFICTTRAQANEMVWHLNEAYEMGKYDQWQETNRNAQAMMDKFGI
jgi:hypothetical protein